MGYKLETVLMRITEGDVVMDDYVVFSSMCRILQVEKDVEVIGILSISHTNVHIPKYIFISPYAMHPIDFFILQYIKNCTSARVFDIPAIGCKKTEAEKIRSFLDKLRLYMKDHDITLYTIKGEKQNDGLHVL